MKDGTFETYGSRDYEYTEGGWSPVAPEPIQEISPKNYDADIKQLKQEVAMLKMTLKTLMDAVSRQDASNHPLY